MTIGDHLFGLPILRVQDVFMPDGMTRVPLAPPEIAGLLNLRGRIVTAIDMRRRLDFGRRERRAGRWRSASNSRAILRAAGRCDRRGDAASGRRARAQAGPISTRGCRAVSAGVYRLDGQLMVILDVDGARPRPTLRREWPTMRMQADREQAQSAQRE